ncbi:MAG: hypothetical protein J5594_05080 [Elusimicrobiaceae bacterium]|nr:hypothetical protein [Elusimicrobiaceae bacterium]
MKKKLLLSLLVLGFPLLVIAQDTKTTTKAANVLPVKKVTFDLPSTTKSPFISQQEADKIEADKIAAENARKAAENAARIAWEEQQKEILRKKLLCDEMKRHPARLVNTNINLDGIMGRDAIINGQILSKGSKFVVPIVLAKDLEGCDIDYNPEKFKIKVVSVTTDSVWLVYKGERFQVKLPLL